MSYLDQTTAGLEEVKNAGKDPISVQHFLHIPGLCCPANKFHCEVEISPFLAMFRVLANPCKWTPPPEVFFFK